MALRYSELDREDAALRAMLIPLWPLLKTDNLVELSVVRPGQVGLEIAGSGYRFEPAPHLDYNYWYLLCQVLANKSGVNFHTVNQPRISTALPEGHRFEAMMGKNVDQEISVSIRLKRQVSLSLEDFGLQGALKDRIIQSIILGANVIVSGGTSSGKTTFLNRLINYIPSETRILTVEDTRELDIPHVNQKNYIVSRNESNPAIDYAAIIDHLLRSRPDMIIAGEVSVANAFPIIRMLNSGHAGFMCTIHANTPDLALTAAIPQNIQLAGGNSLGIAKLLYQTIDIVLQLHRTQTGARVVTEVLFPKNKESLVVEIS